MRARLPGNCSGAQPVCQLRDCASALGWSAYSTVDAAKNGNIIGAISGAINLSIAAIGFVPGAKESIADWASGNGAEKGAVQSREGSFPAADPETAAANLDEASSRTIAALKDGSLDMGLDEATLGDGLDGIKFESVDDLPGVADIRFRDTPTGLRDIQIRVDRQGAGTLAEAFRSVGHELGHLTPGVRALSPDAPPGMPSAFSLQERAAERIGVRVGRHFGF